MTFAVGDSVRFSHDGLRGSGIILRFIMNERFVVVRLSSVSNGASGWPSPHDGPGMYWNVRITKLQANTTKLGNSYE